MKTILNANNLFLIHECVEREISRLEKLHDQICPYLGRGTKDSNAPLTNLAGQREKLKKAKEQLNEVFEGQFK